MNNNEINRVQNYLRQKFGKEIKLHPPEKIHCRPIFMVMNF